MSKHHWLHIWHNGPGDNEWVVDDVSHYHDSAGIIFHGTRDDAIMFAHNESIRTGAVIDSIDPMPPVIDPRNDNIDSIYADIQRYVSQLTTLGHSGPVQYAVVILTKDLMNLAGKDLALFTLDQLKRMINEIQGPTIQ
jgi:hypothetical protein